MTRRNKEEKEKGEGWRKQAQRGGEEGGGRERQSGLGTVVT